MLKLTNKFVLCNQVVLVDARSFSHIKMKYCTVCYRNRPSISNSRVTTSWFSYFNLNVTAQKDR